MASRNHVVMTHGVKTCLREARKHATQRIFLRSFEGVLNEAIWETRSKKTNFLKFTL
jgi:hypothetical protein